MSPNATLRRSARLQARATLPAAALQISHVEPKASAKPLTTFNLFPKLPQQLKDMVWKLLLVEEERIVSFWVKKSPGKPTEKPTNKNDLVLHAQQSVLLRVCANSRTVALRFCTIKLEFNAKPNKPVLHLHSNDILRFRRRGRRSDQVLSDLKGIMEPEHTNQISQLMVEVPSHMGIGSFIHNLSRTSNIKLLPQEFAEVKTLTVLRIKEECIESGKALGRKSQIEDIQDDQCLNCHWNTGGNTGYQGHHTAEVGRKEIVQAFDDMHDCPDWSPTDVRMVQLAFEQ